MSKFKKGFTLIELLVVIAIIGILASIVLVSLNDARNKGYDTQVKSDLAQIRNQMEMCYDDQGGSYAGCGALITIPGAPACSAGYAGNEVAAAWAYSGGLCSGGANPFWCVDSTGVSKHEAAALGAGVTACP